MGGKKKPPDLFIFTAPYLVFFLSILLNSGVQALVYIRITGQFVKRADFWAPNHRMQILCRSGNGERELARF